MPNLTSQKPFRNRAIMRFGVSALLLGTWVLAFLPATAQQAISAAAKPEMLPTGMSITPTAARGSTFEALNPDLAALPQFTVDHPITTALSPDGGTLLILTSGYNRNFDEKGKKIPELSNEYVFIYDVRGAAPRKQQVVQVLNTYVGLAWAPDGKAFYVSGGSDDNVHVFVLADGRWSEVGDPIKLEHSA